ncbi:class A beta-lactamase-related serine hydrolase [Micromonospora sp. KC606]|uniref:serine hydrolase n=1 Tax=Micromonospora sp. KC606 TaxID=2530379 RepID=UPI001051C1FD|nr:serine hydrolase domain-containing protein [Micromonospora sp. KC606]TDC71324.1 class A beta-lactamase-related serine hydrolase [Micromonospora sp. KC606]
MTTTRRSMLTLLGAAALAGAVLAPARAGAAPAAGNVGGRVPTGLKPGGELDRLVIDLAARDQFSGTVLLTYRGSTVLGRSYGMADKARSVPNGPRTAFALASVTKLFTAVAVAQLVERRGVAYTDPVGRFLDALLRERLLTRPFTHITLSGKVPMPPPSGATPPPTTFQCYGPIGGYVNGHATLGHGGGSPGASTSLDLYPDACWSVVVLCNYGDNAALPVVRLARRIITTT